MSIRQSHILLTTILYLMAPFTRAAEILDSSFGQGRGYVTTAFNEGVTFSTVKIQSDGKIVAAGFTQNPNTQAIIVRYNTDGSLDTSFGTDGIVTTNIGSITSTTVVNNLAIQSTGELVVVGFTVDGGPTNAFIARYTASGVLDGTFGAGGIVINSFGGSSSELNGVTIQTDGSSVVVGDVTLSGRANGLVARFDTAGSLDTTFGGSGFVTQLTGGNTRFKDVTLDSSANIVVTGFASVSGQEALTARYTSLGVLDATFGTGGVVTTQIDSNTMISSVAIDSSGNVIIAGLATVSSQNNFLVIRYTSAGVLDTSFNGSGSVTTLVGGASTSAEVVIQTDGKIFVTGFVIDVVDRAAAIRYNSDGSLDTTFGSGGIVALDLGLGSRFGGVALQTSDGRAVAAGFEIDPTTDESLGLVARFNKNNIDFVKITSIPTSVIDTKIPIISGTSSAPSAQVQVSINGTVFTTVSTDLSGNWNAGVSPVLLVGSNLIRADLIVASTVVVSDEMSVTVIDEFGEDAVFAYDTTTQAALTGTFTDVTLNNNGQIGTWSHTLGTASFICGQAGSYQISYLGTATAVADSGSFSASLRLLNNGTPLAGSQITNSLTVSNTITAGSILLLDSSIIAVLAAGDEIKLQASGSNVQLAPAGSGTQSPSAALIITRIA